MNWNLHRFYTLDLLWESMVYETTSLLRGENLNENSPKNCNDAEIALGEVEGEVRVKD